MHFPASNIACAEPVCPSCSAETAEDERACRSCGYSFEFAARLLPYEAPDLRKFIDHEGYLTREDIKRGQKAMEKLRSHFPQVTICTCIAKRVPFGKKGGKVGSRAATFAEHMCKTRVQRQFCQCAAMGRDPPLRIQCPKHLQQHLCFS